MCLLTSYRAGAECRELYLQDSKSSGAVVKGNNCLESPHLSVGTVVELAAKGRLWLKSVPSDYVKSRFQLICQNRSESYLSLELSDMLSPWLSLSKLKGCDSWVDNKLNCNDADGKPKGLYCVLSPLKENTVSQSSVPERTTSIKMRELGTLIDSSGDAINFDEQQLEVLKSELQLCNTLNQVAGRISIQWAVDTDGTVNMVDGTIAKSTVLNCYKAVVGTFPYPSFNKKRVFKSTF